MPTQNASATLTSSFTAAAITGFLDIKQGVIDVYTGTIKPITSGRWSQLQNRTWSSFNNWGIEKKKIIWTSDRQDLGEIKYFTLDIAADVVGSVDRYTIYVCDNQLFGSDTTITVIENGDFDIPAFYGQYFYVQITATADQLGNIEITASNRVQTIYLRDIDTSTLTGSSSSRTLSLSLPISQILDMDIMCKAASSYAVNLYVSDTATSKVLIPIVISKNAASPQFALVGIDNDYRDGVVDITLTCLPRQIMGGGSVYTVLPSE